MMKPCISAITRSASVSALLVATLCTQARSDGNDQLYERIARGDTTAMREAAEQDRKDLIPVLERAAESNQRATWVLAKLGVKKYMDEIIKELTDPAST